VARTADANTRRNAWHQRARLHFIVCLFAYSTALYSTVATAGCRRAASLSNLTWLLPALPPGAAAAAHTSKTPRSTAQAEAGFPFVFPFTIPCNQFYNVAPWAPPASIPTPTPGLLAIVNSTPVFADVVLCCGGTISFQWTVSSQNLLINFNAILVHQL